MTPLAVGSRIADALTISGVIDVSRLSIAYAGVDPHGGGILVTEAIPSSSGRRGPDGEVIVDDDAERTRFELSLATFERRQRDLWRTSGASLSEIREPLTANATVYGVEARPEGRSLRDWAKSLGRRATQQEIDALLVQVLSAIEALHDRDLCHFNVTPLSIHVEEGGRVRLAHPRAAPDDPGPAADRAFAPPEILAGDIEAMGPRSDVFGLAGTLHWLVSGSPPVVGPTTASARWAPTPMADKAYRPEFLKAIALGLAPCPESRPASLKALSELLFDDPRIAPPPVETEKPPEPTLRLVQRSPWFAIAILSAIVLAGISYLGLRPFAPRRPVVADKEAPIVAAPKVSQSPVAAAPRAKPAAAPATANSEAAPSPKARIAAETDRDALIQLAQEYPPLKEAALARLTSLGFVPIASRSQTLWLRPGPGARFRDCEGCPEMVALPPGEFLSGAPPADPGGREGENDPPGPGTERGKVRIPAAFALGRTEVTVGEFAAFARETGYRTVGGCFARANGRELHINLSWSSPGFEQRDDSPAACLNFEDANAYAAWLSRKSGARYRLPREAEWEYAARAGATTRYFFGEDESDICAYANVADLTAARSFPYWKTATCHDGFSYTAPAGAFKPNAFGLYDMLGNLWEWTADCLPDSPHSQAGTDGAAGAGACAADAPRVLRGGSWSDPPSGNVVAARLAGSPDTRDQIAGFRVARSLDAQPQ
jgi:formylglycine-generating enzyme required for sulfatase activity